MNWNFSFENFKKYGPDHPNNVDFDMCFPRGANILWLPKSKLATILDITRVFITEHEILKNVSINSKWKQLEKHIANGNDVAPPWGKLNNNNTIVIAQGLHRFQYAVINSSMDSIPIVIEASEGERLSINFDISTQEMQ